MGSSLAAFRRDGRGGGFLGGCNIGALMVAYTVFFFVLGGGPCCSLEYNTPPQNRSLIIKAPALAQWPFSVWSLRTSMSETVSPSSLTETAYGACAGYGC